VARATGKQRDAALYFDEMGEAKVPVGFGRDGQPVYLNFEFVDGTRGAHVSISGVSGIASRGRDRPCGRPPRTDPSVRDYRTGLLPWVCGGEAHLREGMHHTGGW
ncbi:MAG: hypothetical protein ACRDOK_14170, partial [Streptosporangiaceae bacterium]